MFLNTTEFKYLCLKRNVTKWKWKLYETFCRRLWKKLWFHNYDVELWKSIGKGTSDADLTWRCNYWIIHNMMAYRNITRLNYVMNILLQFKLYPASETRFLIFSFKILDRKYICHNGLPKHYLQFHTNLQ